jgi:hypothetical protein
MSFLPKIRYISEKWSKENSILVLKNRGYLCYNKEIANSVRRYLHQDVYIGKRQSGFHGAILYIKRIEAVRGWPYNSSTSWRLCFLLR